MNTQTLFMANEEGYHTFRIPTLLVTQQGTVLAFCEARMNGSGDAGDIDVVLRRSLDHGETWEPMKVIADDGGNTLGNPCPVQDRDTGTIWLILNRNLEHGDEKAILAGKAPRDVLVARSDDDGVTWSQPVDITRQVKLPDWTWYAAGPCHGIQLNSGRLLIPCNHAVLDVELGVSGPYISHVIYSDDHGDTWHIGGMAGEQTNECTLAEMQDGSIYLNMRSYHGSNQRAYAWSEDGGMSWSETRLDEALVEPVCQGSILSDAQNYLYFSNPASVKRERLTVKCSKDSGKTWTEQWLLHPGPSAYSDLALGQNGFLLCMYECGDVTPYERIALARFSVSD
jgi:sialidase-1